MSRTGLLLGLGALLWSSCRDRAEGTVFEPIEALEPQTTGVRSPGSMTVRTAPIPGLDMVDGVWALSDVVLHLCDGARAMAEVESGAVRVDGMASIPLPALSEDQISTGVCGLEVRPDGILRVDGLESEQALTFTLELTLPPLLVDFEAPIDTTDAALRLELGGADWVQAEWLGLVSGEHVTIRDDHPQSDTIVGRLAEVAVTDDVSGAAIGSTEVERVEPAMHLAVGEGGWVMGSFDDGWSWMELRPAVDPGTEADLFAVAVSDSGVAVAVGGSSGGTVLQSRDGAAFEEVSIATAGLRDVAWTGTMFLAVGLEGAVATSSDGLVWVLRGSLGACHFQSIAQRESDILLVGQDDSDTGCVWSSGDAGASFDEVGGLPAGVLAADAMDDGFVTIGSTGMLSWSFDRGMNWSSVVLNDGSFFDLVYWEGGVQVLGETSIHYTTDFVRISLGETAGFTGFVPALGGDVLLAVTADGEVWQAPRGEARTLADWAERGAMGRSEGGHACTDVVAWLR